MIAHLAAAAAVLAMLCAILWRVIPSLAEESVDSRPLRSWLDMWLPLLLALPVAALPLLAATASLPSPLPLTFASVIPVAVLTLIAAIAVLAGRDPIAPGAVENHHLIALGVLAIMLLLAAIAGRVADWTGHLMLTAAILWLWTVSADGHASPRALDGAVFLVDWSGPLSRPLGGAVRSVLLVGPVLLIAAAAGPLIIRGLPPQPPHRAAALAPLILTLLIAAYHLVVLFALQWRLGPAACLRCATSTVILAVLLGLGVMCLRLIPWASILLSIGAEMETSYVAADVTGASILCIPALLVLLLAAVSLARISRAAALRPLGSVLLATAVFALVSGGWLVASHWPAAPRQPTTPAEAAAEPAG